MTIRGVKGLLATAVVLACLSAPMHAQSRFGGRIALSSQLVDRGIAITPATAVLQGAVSWSSPSGWSAGVAGGVETRSPGDPVLFVAQVSRAWAPSGDWLVQASLLHYDYGSGAGSGGARSGFPDRGEAGLSLTYRDTVVVGLSAIRVSGHRDQRWLGAMDAGASWPLTRRLSLSAGAGVAQAVVRDYGRGYRRYDYGHLRRYGYGNLGLAWNGGPWRLQLDRNLNSLGTRRAYGSPSASDWMVTLSRSF